jgi:phosphate transport system protein
LAAVDGRLSDLLEIVCQAVADATEGLLRDDGHYAVDITSRWQWAEPLYEQVARDVEVLMARQAPMASDLRYLLAVVRAVPELEQSAALADEIAHRGGLGIAGTLTPRARALVTRSGDIVTAMWQELGRAWERRELVSESLEAARQELRDLHTSLTAEVASQDLPASVTMDMALIGRFYARLGDHAVNIADRLDTLRAWGETASQPPDGGGSAAAGGGAAADRGGSAATGGGSPAGSGAGAAGAVTG